MIFIILQMTILLIWFVQGHMTKKEWGQDLNQVCLVAESVFLTIM